MHVVGPPTVLPETSRLVEHELGPGFRCRRCGADYSWWSGMTVGTVVLGLRDTDDGPVYALPFLLAGRRVERCGGEGKPWPPRIRMITRNRDDGVLVVVGYERVPE